jgi:hypothetical protein
MSAIEDTAEDILEALEDLKSITESRSIPAPVVNIPKSDPPIVNVKVEQPPPASVVLPEQVPHAFEVAITERDARGYIKKMRISPI